MTTPTTEPTTEAGQRYLDEWPLDSRRKHVPATEAEAAATEKARADALELARDRLLMAVEAAILNIQHDRIGAAITGLRVARDLTRALEGANRV